MEMESHTWWEDINLISDLSLIKKLKKNDKVTCKKNYKDKFIQGEEYEFLNLDLNNQKITIKYIKYKDNNESVIKVNVKFIMNLKSFIKYFDIYDTIKPYSNDNGEFEWDWED